MLLGMSKNKTKNHCYTFWHFTTALHMVLRYMNYIRYKPFWGISSLDAPSNWAYVYASVVKDQTGQTILATFYNLPVANFDHIVFWCETVYRRIFYSVTIWPAFFIVYDYRTNKSISQIGWAIIFILIINFSSLFVVRTFNCRYPNLNSTFFLPCIKYNR